jgi:tRNA 2-thiouridine synthesizing protein A
MRIVDVRGQKCPAPLIATKKALKESESGDSFKVIIDSKNAFENISRFLIDNKVHFESEEKEGFWDIIITKSTGFDQDINAEDYCDRDTPYFKQGDHDS